MNSKSCMVRLGAGVRVPLCSNVAPFIYTMYGLSLDKQVYFG